MAIDERLDPPHACLDHGQQQRARLISGDLEQPIEFPRRVLSASQGLFDIDPRQQRLGHDAAVRGGIDDRQRFPGALRIVKAQQRSRLQHAQRHERFLQGRLVGDRR